MFSLRPLTYLTDTQNSNVFLLTTYLLEICLLPLSLSCFAVVSAQTRALVSKPYIMEAISVQMPFRYL